MATSLDDFGTQIECIYKGEHYLVRDNGAVLRHSREGKRLRPIDNQWMWGKPNNKTGYVEIASVPVHRIVATAFHGEPPTKEHVVDHIDTNKQNNRPENLRWVTRLENILLNPITVKRIEFVCGCSVEEFLTDPSKFRGKFQEPNYEWMCAVSIQEAHVSKQRLLAWAKSDKMPSNGSLGEWIFSRGMSNKQSDQVAYNISSLTSNATQKDWKTPSHFHCCPEDSSNNPIATYCLNLQEGKVFSENQYSRSVIRDFAPSQDGTRLFVVCENIDANANKPWTLTEVTFQHGLFVHANLGSYFKKDGAEKNFTLAQGLEWEGGATFDDLV